MISMDKIYGLDKINAADGDKGKIENNNIL